MFSAISKRLTYSNVAATLALVFAMSGGAYAMSGGGVAQALEPSAWETASAPAAHRAGSETTLASAAKKKAKSKSTTGARGPAGPAGKTGPAGAAGPAGPAGEKGAAGSNGTNGTNGTNGKSVVASAASEAECKEKVGGTKLEVEGSGKPEHVCNGKNGTTGFTETLPGGKTETGVWGVGPTTSGFGRALISFTIPLKAALTESHLHYIKEGPEKLEVIIENGVATTNTQPSTACLGTVLEPTAEPGNLCVYENSNSGAFEEFETPSAATKDHGAGRAGVEAYIVGSVVSAQGSWALTAPEEP
jgi:hypothetical protein